MKTVCVQCRVRKVRCDGSQPSCATCTRLRLVCSFATRADGAANRLTTAVELPPKYRSSLACQRCRSRKIRCSGDTPECAECVRRNQPCAYATVQGVFRNTTRSSMARETSRRVSREVAKNVSRASEVHPQSSRQTPSDNGPSPGPNSSPPLSFNGHAPTLNTAAPTIMATSTSSGHVASPPSLIVAIDGKLEAELVDQYFRYLHALPAYSFLHQSTVVQRCREHSINPALKAALCAITALFMGCCAEQRDNWAAASESLVFEGLSHPSIFHLQALLLVIRYRAESGGFSRAFMLSGLAARLAAALRLNYEHHELSPVAQEVRRRTFWSLYFLEEVFCSGLREFELSHPDIIYLQLPREDINFANEAGPPTNTGYLIPGLGLEPSAIGPRGLFVKLALVRRNIMKFNRQIYGKEMNLANLYTTLDSIQNQLQRISLQMAPSDRYPPAEPDAFTWSPQYAMLHMSYYQCHCDLFRSFLRGHPDTAPQSCIDLIKPADVTLMGGRSIQNARQVLCILADYDQHAEPAQPLDWDAAVCAYQATRFLLFGSTYDKALGKRSTADKSAVRIAITKAQDVLDTLTRRFAFSLAVQPMRDDLTRLVTRYRHLLRTSPHDNESVFSAHRGIQVPPGVTKEAGSRQFLAIHSLLLRSDFIDDSREAVTEGTPQQTASVVPTIEHIHQQTTAQNGQAVQPMQQGQNPVETLPATWQHQQVDISQHRQQQQQQMGGDSNQVREYWADATDVNGSVTVTTFDFPPLFSDLMGDGPGFDFGLWSDMLGTYGNPVAQGSIVGLDEQHMY
ncbi:hypothetical protein SEUCBS139899_005574 [Sporothrix eucalyptigena]|uniref:Zn(2)-C6 fungal-type domain-containing protein n=1 Tax=Sporothrix eucalyptigena TaxID=1812306 RepID=A0ABP0C0X2_9PEZI